MRIPQEESIPLANAKIISEVLGRSPFEESHRKLKEIEGVLASVSSEAKALKANHSIFDFMTTSKENRSDFEAIRRKLTSLQLNENRKGRTRVRTKSREASVSPIKFRAIQANNKQMHF